MQTSRRLVNCLKFSSGMMSYNIIVFLSALTIVHCNDIYVGFAASRDRLIFEKQYDLKPSIYIRSQATVVSAGWKERISKIEVTDERELKDGIAKITEGGIGAKTVTITMSGPSVFRGMNFHVKVYATSSKW